MKNYYETLGVERIATHQQTVAAFRKLVLQYHPDRNHSPVASEMFIQVHEAYKVLANPSKRAEYDSRYNPQRQPSSNFRETFTYADTYTYAYKWKGQERPLKWWAPVVPLGAFAALITIFYIISILVRALR